MKNQGQPVTHSHLYMVILTLFWATTLSAFLPRESKADAAVNPRLSSAIRNSGFSGTAHSTCVLKTLSAEQTSVLGSKPFGLDESAEATPKAIPESAAISIFMRVPAGRFIAPDLRSNVLRTIPTVGLFTQSYEGSGIGVSNVAVGEGSAIGGGVAFATARGVAVGEGFTSVASVVGISRCSSEYVTAKETTTRHTIATAIRVFIQGDIVRPYQPKGDESYHG